MKSLTQYIDERLIINKNLNNYNFIDKLIIDAFKKILDKHDVRIKGPFRGGSRSNCIGEYYIHINIHKFNDEIYSDVLTDFSLFINDNFKEISFPFDTSSSASSTYVYYEVTNDKNIMICVFDDIDHTKCRAIWVIGKDYNEYLVFSKASRGVLHLKFNDRKGRGGVSVNFSDLNLVKTYELNGNAVPTFIELISKTK